ncbi:MAG: T9SS type A sorting domain-containing protein [bacterium]|nr:T9SS type A sorting domain-containing protein [bacterium]
MNRWFATFLVMLIAVCASTHAQTLQITAAGGFGPFTSGSVSSNSFTIQGYPSGAVADSVSWQIVVKDGPNGALRVVRTAKTVGPWVTTMGDLPFLPNPQLNATVSYTYNGQKTSRTLVSDIKMTAPTITWIATNNWAGIPIKSAFTGRFGVTGCPPGTTRIVIYLHPIFGANLDSVVRNGTNLDSATLRYSTMAHNGALSIQAVMTFPGAPPGGYLIAKAIPDILPAVNVKASLGYGPFTTARTALNVFTIDSTLGSYTSAVFTFTAGGRYGAVYSVGKQTAPWVKATDRFQITANMGDLPPYSTLRVDMINSSGQISNTQMVPIKIIPSTDPPLFTMRRQPPVVFQSNGSDSIVLDTLPARTMRAKLTLLSPTSQFIKDTSLKTGAIGFLTRAPIKFNGGSLPKYTHTLRAEFWNDYSLDAAEFDYYFDVRDTTVPYLFASTYGPFIQSDSATFSMGITDVRAPSQTVTKRVGWFQLVDTLNGRVLLRGPDVALDTVKRIDSLYWGDTISSRALIQTATLPVSAGAQFIDVGINGTDTVFTNVYVHPLLMVARPGVLTASAGYGPFTAGINAPNTFRIDSLPDDTESVEFMVTGTVNTSNIDSLLLTQIVENTAQFTTNMGMLPVNARLTVTVRTTNGPHDGVSLIRFLHTVPDTLFMQPTLKFDTLAFAWQTSSAGARTQITGPRVIPDTFVVRRLPAQTERITVATFDLQGNRIDSTTMDVSYRVRFDSTLVVKVPFVFTAFSTSRIEFRIFSTGGLPDGIMYGRRIAVKPAPFSLAARRYTTTPPYLDTVSVHQGSADQMDMTTRVVLAGSNYGFAPNIVIDSTRIRFLTCFGTRVDSLLPAVAASNPATNVVSDTTFPITVLPVTTTRAEVTIYSKMLTLPAQGFVYSDTIRIVPGPVTYAPMRGDFPTFRVNDTVRHALYNPYTLRQLPLIDSISQYRVVNSNNVVVASYPAQVPQRDSVLYIVNMDSTAFPPSGSPYRILAQANYTVCTEKRTYAFAVDTFTVTRTLPDPIEKNYIYSTAGWGPFKTGKGKFSQFFTSLRPGQFITSQDTLGADQLVITVSAIVKINGVDSLEATYITSSNTVLKGAAIPDVWKFQSTLQQIGGNIPGTFIKMKVDWVKVRTAGSIPQASYTYYFPMLYTPFPPQPIISSDGWGPFDQSVSAGGTGVKTMAHPITITDSVGSDIIRYVQVYMIDYRGKVIDSLRMTPGAKLDTGINLVQLFTMPSYDVAQFPWPSVARDNKNITMFVGYYFENNLLMGGSQKETIQLNPRPYWLNNSLVDATSVIGTNNYLTVLTPLPTPSFTTTLPLIGSLPFKTGGADGNLYISHKVIYLHTSTRSEFLFQSSDLAPSSTFGWNPEFGNLGVASVFYVVTATDGEQAPPFSAIRKFEPDAKGNLAQNLRLRAKIDAKVTVSPTTLFKVVEKVLQLVGMIPQGPTSGAVEFAPTFALSLGSEQLMNINMGVDTSDQMTHIGQVPEVASAGPSNQNTFPTALSTAFIYDFSFGGEIKLVKGFLGVGISLNNIMRFNWGSTFQGPLSNVKTTTYPVGISDRVYVVVDVSVFWGLFRHEIYRGQLISINSRYGIPTFSVFPQSFNSFFQTGTEWYDPKGASIETPQVDTIVRQPLPPETPVYYSTPSVDANDSAVVVAWTEHSLRGKDGSVMLGRVNKETSSFRTTSLITTGRNGVHDPVAQLLDTDGTTLVAWNQNRNDAAVTGGTELTAESAAHLMLGENIHASIVDAKGVVKHEWVLDGDASSNNIDGRAAVTVSRDGKSALIAWPVQHEGRANSEVVAVILNKTGDTWTSSAPTMIAPTPGHDQWIDVAPVGDGEFLVVWKHDVDNPEAGADVMWSKYNGSWSAPAALRSSAPQTKIESISLDGNGDYAVLAIGSSVIDAATNVHTSSVAAYEFTTTWQEPTTLSIAGAQATVSDLDVSVGSSGRSHVIVDLLYATAEGNAERKSHVFSAADASASWLEESNSKGVYDSDHRVWSMSSAIGPNNVMYVATQELDSTPGNVQQYSNGVQVGANRINTVLRAVRLDNSRLVSVPFNGQPVSVQDDPIEKSMRYPCALYPPYPNPTSGDANVTFTVLLPTNVRVDVVDVTGRVMQTLVNADLADGIYDVAIPITSWPQGCYTVRMTTGTGQLLSKQFTVIR